MNKKSNKIQKLTAGEVIIEKTQSNDIRRPFYINTLNIFVKPVRGRYEKYYKNSRKHLAVDIFFVIIILILIAINIYLFNKNFDNLVGFEIKFTREAKEPQNIKSTELLNVIDTKIIFLAKSIYYTEEGEQLGLGPWPPKVNEPTTLRVIIEAAPESHPVENFQLKIELWSKVKYVDKSAVSLGEALLYDEKNKLLYWHAESFKAGEKAMISFAIEFTPEFSDEGEQIEILKKAVFSAVDSATERGIRGLAGPIYSEPVIRMEEVE